LLNEQADVAEINEFIVASIAKHIGHSSRIRFLRFFENSKKATFYVFLKRLSKKRKKT